jgi:hypothetical protein
MMKRLRALHAHSRFGGHLALYLVDLIADRKIEVEQEGI